MILLTFTDWTQCIDANTGHPYYWNIDTKEVTWEIPHEYKQFLDKSALLNPNSKKNWILCFTDDNTPYYFNESTREILWEKPSDYVEMSTTSIQSSSNSGTNNDRKKTKIRNKPGKKNPFAHPIDEYESIRNHLYPFLY